jgi:two-component system sensor kinase
MNRAELLPPSPGMAFSYAFHACLISMFGWHARAAPYGELAQKVGRELSDLRISAHSSHYQGIGMYASARFEDGLARLIEAIAAFEKVGDLREVCLARFHKGCCHFGLGEIAEAVAEARWTFASSARLGDARMFCSSYLWARATRGNLPFEDLKSCYPCRPDDIMSTVHGIMAEGHWHRFHGRTAESVAAFEQAGKLIRKNFCVNSHMIVALPELATALRLHAETLAATDPQECQRLRARSYRLSKWGARITRLFPAAYPLTLRELAEILVVRGKLAKALKVADRSCAVAEKQKARYEHAQSLLVRGRIAQRLNRPEAAEQIRTAEAAMTEMESKIPADAKGR